MLLLREVSILRRSTLLDELLGLLFDPASEFVRSDDAILVLMDTLLALHLRVQLVLLVVALAWQHLFFAASLGGHRPEIDR